MVVLLIAPSQVSLRKSSVSSFSEISGNKNFLNHLHHICRSEQVLMQFYYRIFEILGNFSLYLYTVTHCCRYTRYSIDLWSKIKDIFFFHLAFFTPPKRICWQNNYFAIFASHHQLANIERWSLFPSYQRFWRENRNVSCLRIAIQWIGGMCILFR